MAVEAQLKKTRVLATPMGRKRMFFGRWSAALLRDAYAYVPQSTVADVALKGMLNLYEKLPEDCELVFNIHDEIVIQTPKTNPGSSNASWTAYLSAFMIDCMSVPVQIGERVLTIPVGIKTGMNWNEVS